MCEHKVGYACMNLDVTSSSFKTCRVSNLTETLHKDLIKANLDYLEEMIDYNILNAVRMYRISSSLIPFASHEKCELEWKAVFKEKFQKIGEKIINNKIRVSMHPGQYTLINSPNPKVVQDSFKELEYHADVLELLGVDYSSKLILHIGGVYGDKKAAISRFVKNYEKLPTKVLKRLVIENDDKFYTLDDVLKISEMSGAPVVFDNLHHKINNSLSFNNEKEILNMVIKTWKQGEKPKMHYSQQAENKKAGAHSDTIDLKIFANDYDAAYKFFDIDIMLEVKDKNRSFKKVDLFLNPSRRKFEEEWAAYKYLVMSKSYADYLKIKDLFNGNTDLDALEFYKLIDSSLARDISPKNILNTFMHIQGYFKKSEDVRAKSNLQKKIAAYAEKIGENAAEQMGLSERAVGKALWRMAEKSEESYLLKSYFLKQYK